MRALLFACLLGGAAGVALGQGQFNFGNRVTAAGIDAPFYLPGSVTKLEGPAYLAQAYLGLEAGSLTPVGPVLPFRTGAAAGYITSTSVTVGGIPGGTTVFVQMRAWEAAKGGIYEAAVAAGGIYGASAPLSLTLSEPPGVPTDMVGLQPFALIPEPTTLTLAVLGAAALLGRRRGT
ncbi:MAG: hypothetical protein HS113_17245 [Verrucomicrobiales bacterium]|nr:hypothetical protein [Verrucomicrobiales bacterium]